MTGRTEPAIAQNLTIEDLYLQAVERIETLHVRLKRDTNPADTYEDAFAEVQLILDALPLNTDEFALAGNRLRNAARYLKSGDRGAACYELKLLSRNLAHNRHYRVAARAKPADRGCGRWPCGLLPSVCSNPVQLGCAYSGINSKGS